MRRLIYTLFDVVGSWVLNRLTNLPRPIQLILIIIFMLPVLALSVWADRRGESSLDVL